MLFYLFQADGLLLILYFGVGFLVACLLVYWFIGCLVLFGVSGVGWSV